MSGAINSETESILVVDDCQDNLFLMQLILETQGYRVEIANSGEEALREINCHRPDLVLLDLMMPKMNGYEVVKHLRSQKNIPFIPVCFVTADKYFSRSEAIAVGANSVIYKPIDIDILLSEIDRVFNIKATS